MESDTIALLSKGKFMAMAVARRDTDLREISKLLGDSVGIHNQCKFRELCSAPSRCHNNLTENFGDVFFTPSRFKVDADFPVFPRIRAVPLLNSKRRLLISNAGPGSTTVCFWYGVHHV
jgi:hypothetical protein